MSKTRRDQRRRPHSGKKCPESVNGGCYACVTGEYKGPANRAIRRRQRAAIRESIG